MKMNVAIIILRLFRTNLEFDRRNWNPSSIATAEVAGQWLNDQRSDTYINHVIKLDKVT